MNSYLPKDHPLLAKAHGVKPGPLTIHMIAHQDQQMLRDFETGLLKAVVRGFLIPRGMLGIHPAWPSDVAVERRPVAGTRSILLT